MAEKKIKKSSSKASKSKKIKSKFTDLCGSVLGDQKTERVMKAILSLEKMEDMKAFIALL